MYVPRQFRETRPEMLADAIRTIQLAVLVTSASGAMQVSHVPMVLKQDGARWVLETHVARANPHWTFAGAGSSVAVFQGPQAYVSPSWYPTKREHGKVVPTWNYVAVHAHGVLKTVEDTDWLLAHLDDLTRANEAMRHHAWEMSDAPAEFVHGLTRAIVGLQLPVDQIEGAWKMIQHRSAGDRAGTIAGLEVSENGKAVADVMRRLEEARGDR